MEYYKLYIDLGFEREDFDDKVEFNQTGYYGFCLTKKVNERMSVSVCSGELDKPKLLVKKSDTDFCYYVNITLEAVKDLLSKEKSTNLYYLTTKRRR